MLKREAQMYGNRQQAGLDKYNGELNSRIHTDSILEPILGSNIQCCRSYQCAQYVQDDLEKRDILKAEACFIRATQYFSLVQYWGAVPIIDYSRQIELGTRRQLSLMSGN